MRLKNKLLSIGAILLLSCQYTPAQAQVVDNSLNQTTLNPVGAELTLCEDIAEFAEDVSDLRQNRARYEDVIALAPKPTTQDELGAYFSDQHSMHGVQYMLFYQVYDLIGETSHKTGKLVLKPH